MKKKILLIGSTGSIGTSACNCIRRFPDKFQLVGLSTNTTIERLGALAKEFAVYHVCIGAQESSGNPQRFFTDSTKLFRGPQGLIDLINAVDFDILLNALVGAAGFPPTVAALQGKLVALANKESLVIGGDIIDTLLSEGHGSLIPIDSEHSAILQCLNGENTSAVESITITASGGPFRDTDPADFASITLQAALNHPVWSMGKKITIDSSTLMNKGFEVIEAHYLFKLPYDKLQVIIHPQSIVHSMVTFHDGAVMAQCGLPDMELPIQYALTYPDRLPIMGKRLDLSVLGSLTFKKPDCIKFPCLKHCIEAGRMGGTILTVLNAANEIAVHEFLRGTIPFTHIPRIIEKSLNDHTNHHAESVEQICRIDQQTRKQVLDAITAGTF